MAKTAREAAPGENRVEPRAERPWGFYQTIERDDGYLVKRIVVKPGGRLSLQKHRYRSEHWVVVRGTAKVTCDDMVRRMGRDESVHIPKGAVHRLENAGEEPLHLIEVQLGDNLDDDDIVRFEDDYGRD